MFNQDNSEKISQEENLPICYFIKDDNERKRFPFNLRSFINSSNYFFKRRKEYNEGDSIPLLKNESRLHYSDELIEYFISICENNEQANLTESNVYQLYELSDLYEITRLQNDTKDYIAKHEEQLILQSIIYNKNKKEINHISEHNISKNLMKYIVIPDFCSLSFDSIYRIFEEYRLNNPIMESENATEEYIEKETKIKDFFLNYLQKEGQKASFLFNFIDYKRFSNECLIKIRDKFADIFKYSFLNEKILSYIINSNLREDSEQNNVSKSIEKVEREEIDDKEDEQCLLKLNEIEKKIEKCETIPNVVLPNLKLIPMRFFRYVPIVSITIPDSVIEICNGAFSCCGSLTEVIFNETSQLKTIGEYAFFGCKILSKFQIPKTVTFIGYDAFMYCYEIDVKIPSGLKSIERRIFYACKSLKSAIIPSSIKSIQIDAFNGCESMTNVVFPESLETIEYNGFVSCYAITKIVLPPSLKSVIKYSFGYCTHLQEVQFSSPIELIDTEAFMECKLLEVVKFLSYVKLIKIDAFKNCCKLKDIQFKYSPDSIEGCAFNGCSSLQKIEFPTSVKLVQSDQFKGCSELKEVRFLSSVEIVNTNAFNECKSLEFVKFLSSIQIIKSEAFNGCTNLKEIQFSSSPDSVDGKAFNGCSSSHIIKFLQSVKTIKSKSFTGCSELNEIQFLGDLELIESHAFSYCSSLQTVKFLSSVKRIGNCSFMKCSKLSDVHFSLNVEHIGENAFYGCSSLKQMEFPASLKSIEHCAFYDSGLTKIKFEDPLNLDFIGDSVFWTSAFNKIEIPAVLRKKIGDFCFSHKVNVTLTPNNK